MTQASASPRKSNLLLIGALLLVLIIGGFYWFQNMKGSRPHLAIVTASSGPYWDLLIRGAKDAADRYDAQLDVITPESDPEKQSDAILSLVGKGYDGVAVSPNDPVRQAQALAELSGDSKLVTFDSDSPVSNRICFIGTDNYDAGRTAGQHMKQAVPSGGEILIAIGSLEKQNGQQRRQGVIDELLDRPFEPQRSMDPVDATLKGPKYTVVATLVDGIKPDVAEKTAADAMAKHPEVKGIVCLFAYNTPAVLKSLQSAGKLGKIQVVGFDTNEETLAGIEQGKVYATMMQDPYYIGMESIRILAEASRGNRQAVPLFQQYNLTCDPVVKGNVAGVRDQLAARLAGRPAPMEVPVPHTEAAATDETITTEPATAPAGIAP